MKPLFEKGHVFHGPEGQGYLLVEDVFSGTPILSKYFYPVGGAPKPVAGELIVEWLAKQIINIKGN